MPCPDRVHPGDLPAAWVERLRRDFDPHPGVADRILNATAAPRRRGLRLHGLRGDPDATRRELDALGLDPHPVPWSDRVLIVEDAAIPVVTATDAWREGRVVVQSPTSILAAMALAPRPGERIIDLCAAPGGKTAAIADLADGDLDLVANDRSRPRCHRMRALFEMLGVRATIRTGPGERTSARDRDGFDRVLVDAPCSGEGRFRADDPDSIGGWTPKATRRLASLQKSLLHAAIGLVRPGGVVVYATCTLGRVENEEVVARALTRYGEGPTGVELEPLPEAMPTGLPLLDPPGEGEEAEAAMRRWAPDPEGEPWQRAMDGFFVARLRRRGGRTA